ncbi:hypothetical protein [Dyella acidiphila]|uniref:PH domain-containing protein n=1 Tax=Dyella acidiphila TaxID=2775866 RepID=A0ABR9GEA1_9GAMM|nr:hypothetical protein [Dyella acidiphila]MBE1162352.1 hypothetical protein [Dyella acidiphila]
MSVASRNRFKFKGFIPGFVALMLFAGLWIFFACVIPKAGGGLGGVVFCLGVAVLLLALGRVFLIGKLDLVMDDQGVARFLGGKEIQSIPWANVQRIVAYPVRAAGASRNVTAYNILALPSSAARSKTRKIYFNDQSTDLTALLDCLNFYAAKHGLKVELALKDGVG